MSVRRSLLRMLFDVTAVDSSTRSAQTRSSLKFITNVIPNVLGTWNVNTGRPNYLDASKKINVDATLKSYITAYFLKERIIKEHWCPMMQIF